MMRLDKLPLSAGEMAEAVDILQNTLADLIDLSLQVKVAHWNVRGPNFRSAHLEFDEIVAITRDELDEVAERISTIGGSARGGLHAVQELTGLQPLSEGILNDAAAVEAIHQRIAKLTKRARGNLPRLSELDPVSEDLVIGTIGRLEKAGWMLTAQITELQADSAK